MKNIRKPTEAELEYVCQCGQQSTAALYQTGQLPISLNAEWYGAWCSSRFYFYNSRNIFNPSDTIFTYTDGVTEATNANKEFFGEKTASGNFDLYS